MDMKYWLWMDGIKGLGPKIGKKLLDKFETPKDVYNASKSELLLVDGVGVVLADDILLSRSLAMAKSTLERMAKDNIKLLTVTDSLYPKEVMMLPEAPLVLYYRGNLRKHSTGVAIVGARRCSNYGKEVTMEAASYLAKHDVPVISGMAKGIDGYAQTACLKAGGYTIAFLGHGLDICYPKEHQSLMDAIIENGAVISQHPPGTPVKQAYFPMRNYLISAWAYKILIVEATIKSGSLITAKIARMQNREVYAVPNGIYHRESQGTNRLIAEGANIYLEPKQLLKEELNIPITKANSNNLSPKRTNKIKNYDEGNINKLTSLEKQILELLKESNLTVDQLANGLPYNTTQIIETLSIMEIQGLIKTLPGGPITIAKEIASRWLKNRFLTIS